MTTKRENPKRMGRLGMTGRDHEMTALPLPANLDPPGPAIQSAADLSMLDRVNVLVISSNFPPVIGGSGQVYDNLCRVLAPRIHALAPEHDYRSGERLAFAAHDAACDYPVWRIPYLRPCERWRGGPVGRLRELAVYGRLLLTIARLVRRERIKVVCIGDLVYNGWLLWPLRYGLRRRVMVYVHAEEITSQGDGLMARLRHRVLRRADLVICVSQYCRREVMARAVPDPAKVVVIPNGVEPSRFFPPAAPAPSGAVGCVRFLGVGRLVERKGFDTVLRALAQLVREGLPAHLTLIGDGPSRTALESLTRELSLSGRVTFTGAVADGELLAAYRQHDVFVMPNRQLANGDTEGFGLVFLEASAAGMPVIAGRAGGAPEAVLDGETGIVVDGDDLADITRAMRQLATDPARRTAMGARGRTHARANSWCGKARHFAAVATEVSRAPLTRVHKATRAAERVADAEWAAVREGRTLTINSGSYLCICCDTEEEFDWGGPFLPETGRLTSIDGLQRFQAICERHGAVPVYVVTYVAAQNDALIEFLRDRVDAGKADVGLHLHTWNTPPFEHTFSLANTFQRNLPAALEERKLLHLKVLLEGKFGREIAIHKAGRYGLGVRSICTLAKLGFRLDLSLSPRLRTGSLAADNSIAWGGRPFCLPEHDLTFIPNTLLRLPRPLPTRLPTTMATALAGHFARTLRLSAEGVTVEDMISGIRYMTSSEPNMLSFSLHSSSLVAAGNPYSSSEKAVDDILKRVDALLAAVSSMSGLSLASARCVLTRLMPDTSLHMGDHCQH